MSVLRMSNHVAASSMSSVAAYSRGRAVDFRMGWVLAAGGALGSVFPFIIMLLMLLIRPTGLFGWKTIERV